MSGLFCGVISLVPIDYVDCSNRRKQHATMMDDGKQEESGGVMKQTS